MATLNIPAAVDTIDRWLAGDGLCLHQGNGRTEFCAEQLVAAASGEPPTDHPECVDRDVASFGRKLNDVVQWGDPVQRGRGMRDFLVAQLGSRGRVDPAAFRARVTERVTREVVPGLLRRVALLRGVATETAVDLRAYAVVCEHSTNPDARPELLVRTLTLLSEMNQSEDGGDPAVRGRRVAARWTRLGRENIAAAVYAMHQDPGFVAAGNVSHVGAIFTDRADRDGSSAGNPETILRAYETARREVLLPLAAIAVDTLRELRSPGCAYLSA